MILKEYNIQYEALIHFNDTVDPVYSERVGAAKSVY